MAHHHISVVVLSMILIVAACAAAPGTLWRPHSALEPRAAAAAVASSGTAVCPPEGDRVACVSSWRWDFDQRLCEQRGCCYQPSLTDLDWCFNDAPAGAAAHITKVHVVQGCHLDVGFAATAPEILNRWFDEFFPLAYRVGKELQEMNANHSAALQGTNTTLRFTAQSWLISMYIDCPADWEGIHCPNATALAQFHEAVDAGWITWHAFPFNTEPEFYDESMIDFAVQLTHDVDTKLKQPLKTVMSQRDVPGMTRSIIPRLRANGVHTVSVGVNGGSTPPNVPQAFIWADPVSGDNVTALYLSGGYGGITKIKGYHVPTVLPGLSEVMIVDWRGDNAGPPPEASDLIDDFVAIQKQFPGAEVFSSTFDAFAAVVNQGLADQTVSIPTISSEIGDTWIHGVASDPIKHGRTRHAQRLRTECLQPGGDCDLADYRVWNFSRLLLKNGEHTWGLDVKSTLQPTSFQRSNWNNSQSSQLRVSNAEYEKLATSWVTQSRWGLGDAVAALEDHPLAARIKAAWADFTTVTAPSTAGMERIRGGQVVTAGRFSLAFDEHTGALTYLEDGTTGVVWVNSNTPGGNVTGASLGLFEYQTYDEKDYTRFMMEYSYMGPLFMFDDYDDFDKVGIDNTTDGNNATHRVVHPMLMSLWTSNTTDEATFLAEIAMPADVVALAGAPQTMWVQYGVPLNGAGNISVTLQVFNKTATRYPEGGFFRFSPCAYEAKAGGSCQTPSWTMHKLGQEMDPTDVVVGGSRHNHVMSDGGAVATVQLSGGTTASVAITSLDTGLVSFGNPTAFPTPLDDAFDVHAASSLLFDNVWNTNYIMWIGGNFQWRWQWAFQ